MPGAEPPPDVGTGSSWDEVMAGLGWYSLVLSRTGLLPPDMARRGHQYRVVLAIQFIGLQIPNKLGILTIQNSVRK